MFNTMTSNVLFISIRFCDTRKFDRNGQNTKVKFYPIIDLILNEILKNPSSSMSLEKDSSLIMTVITFLFQTLQICFIFCY
jgi:hypothetical protein